MKITIQPELLKLLRDFYNAQGQEIFKDLKPQGDIPQDLKTLLKQDDDLQQEIKINPESAIFCQNFLENLKNKFNALTGYFQHSVTDAKLEKKLQDLANVITYSAAHIQQATDTYHPQPQSDDEKISSLISLYNIILQQEFIQKTEVLFNKLAAINAIQYDVGTKIDKQSQTIIDNIAEDLNKKIDLYNQQQDLINKFCAAKGIDANTITDQKTRQAIILIQLYKDHWIWVNNTPWNSTDKQDDENFMKATNTNNFTEAIKNIFGITPNELKIKSLIETFDELRNSGQLNTCYKKPDLLDKIALLIANIVPDTKWAQKILNERKRKTAIRDFSRPSQ